MAEIKLYLEPKISKTQQSCICQAFSYVLEQVSGVPSSEKLDYLCKATITRCDLSPDSFVLMLRYCANLKAITLINEFE